MKCGLFRIVILSGSLDGAHSLVICVWFGEFGGKMSSPDEQSGGGGGDVNGIQDSGNSICKSTEAELAG